MKKNTTQIARRNTTQIKRELSGWRPLSKRLLHKQGALQRGVPISDLSTLPSEAGWLHPSHRGRAKNGGRF